MKANELRIGNLIEKYLPPSISEWIETETTSIDINYNSRNEKHGYRPIPLNEEWLLKFGFKKYSNGWFELKEFYNSHFQEFNVHLKGKTSVVDGGEEICLITIKHVHQLQNLYFALTSEELEIKE